jgi:hypothetical protein
VFANGGSGNGIEIDSGTVTFSTAFSNAVLVLVKKGAGPAGVVTAAREEPKG